MHHCLLQGVLWPVGGRDVVFFMHGILDTSMGWVSNGVTGSQAFAAFDQGFDVWLGNSRANPPRVHESEFILHLTGAWLIFHLHAFFRHTS